MDVSLMTILLDMPKPKQLEIPFPKEEPVFRLPVGTRISYLWYGATVYGEIVEDTNKFPHYQLARLQIRGAKVLVIIHPNKATVL